MSTSADDETDKNIQIWKIKKLIGNLERARGYVVGGGTSAGVCEKFHRLFMLPSSTVSAWRQQ